VSFLCFNENLAQALQTLVQALNYHRTLIQISKIQILTFMFNLSCKELQTY
jgi:hypothetical protein